ncbi:hypothetical protein C488_19047 [Natrinema pellirubrum DSM 15624]|uniref:PH domain-containing protein n=1 Tax=Natrinema pellirubrum (strain DSM 15624 / CIP 106293 / JCM 10476 / NCIMB 786 / 157) TaxID=797303 RepID=L0JHF4_NATP1|nr:hypothetical protein [Natrinema pellirubrum]AGB29997.1 hypothetical protein Natpe_0050 [Natrinema pellirubrum DSM 15624]ELY70306.1 hypothetical protein C488_19047 [Natrinema pellirubrum DSM 15624]
MAPPDRVFRLAFGGYVGVLVAGLVTVLVVLVRPETTSNGVAGTYAAGLGGGCLVGVVLASRIRGLAVRLGRTWGRRAALVLLPVPFGIAAGASLLTPLESRVLLVALASSIAVAIVGMILRWLVATRYTDAITTGDPIGTWEWTPPGAPKLDALVLALWSVLAVSNAVTEDWAGSLVWIGLAALWLCSGLAEGRWQVGSFGATPEIRVYENGLVKRRPYTRSFVPWDEVSHVRLREDELVLDRGLFDVRFDRDELPELEAVRAEIEGRLPNGATG